MPSLYEKLELVGKGAYGGVYKGVHLETGQVVALKVIDLDSPDDEISEIQKEVAILSEMRDAHRYNITLYHGCYLEGHELWIVMDFASGGSIRTLMKSGPMEEKFIVLVVREVLVALSFLHHQGIIHRDIKAANILLTQDGRILLADFGVAAHLQTNHKRSTFIGTPMWMAPEVITDGKLYDTKADIWSLGIAIYEMAYGNPPFFDKEPLKACALIPTSPPPRLHTGSWSLFMNEFMEDCLQLEPEHRLTADELAKTRWIKSAAKTNMVLLRELIVRYVSWIQMGGQRTSLAGIDSLIREDTFEIEDPAWDFNVETVEIQIEPLGDEPHRSLDDQAAISSIRPPKTSTTHASQVSRNHPLLRLFTAESNSYANNSSTMSNFSSGMSSMDTVRPMISIPSFEEMDEMSASAPPSRFIQLPSDDSEIVSPVTMRPNPFGWTTQQPGASSPFGPPSPRLHSRSPWGSTSSTLATSTSNGSPDQPSFPSSSSSPFPIDRSQFPPSRRRADTASSSDYSPFSSGILSSSVSTPTHSTNPSTSSLSGISTASFSSAATVVSAFSPTTSQRPLPFRARAATESQPDVNRPFRMRKASDVGGPPLARSGNFELTRSEQVSRARAGSESRPVGGLYPRPGLKISTTSTVLSSSASPSSYTPPPASAPFLLAEPSHDSFDVPTPLATSIGYSFPFPSDSEPFGDQTNDSDPPIALSPIEWKVGPPLRPLNYGALETTEDVRLELEKTIQDLGSWLGVVEDGLSKILDRTSA